MKRQCNLCGLRIDTIDLAQKKELGVPFMTKRLKINRRVVNIGNQTHRLSIAIKFKLRLK
jgi:hypothetical protein